MCSDHDPQCANKPAQECGQKDFLKGFSAASAACDDIIAEAWNFFHDSEAEALFDHSCKLVQAAVARPKSTNPRASGKLPGWGKIFEICTSPESTLGKVASGFANVELIRVTEEQNFEDPKFVASLKQQIRESKGCSLHGSLPCTVWSTWQWMAVHRYGPKYFNKLRRRRVKSVSMLKDFIECAELALANGGEVSFEWPRNCAGWLRPELINFIERNQLYTANVDGCACGMTSKKGEPILKQWRFICSSQRQAVSLAGLKCEHPTGFKHGEISGSETKRTESYPVRLCRTMLSSLFGSHKEAPAMCCGAITKETVHREHEVIYDDFQMSPFSTQEFRGISAACTQVPTIPGAVTKLLDRNETRSSPKAIKAIRDEGDALLGAGTWDLKTVIEKDILIKQSKGKKHITMGDLMFICSVKFWEMAVEMHKHKGRIVFRGDNAKDEHGALAIYQEMAASPTTVQSANCNLAYGCLPGHKTTQADAVRAYVQSLLKSKNETWVRIPKELWPAEWHNKGYTAPMCLLRKALYGHPESGGHWENHLTEAVVNCGGVAIAEHPSSFWFEERKLLLTVYVDDLLLSGPEGAHAKFWNDLRNGKFPIHIDDPEPLDRFLGRTHVKL